MERKLYSQRRKSICGGDRMKILLAIFCFPVFLLLELAKKQ